MGSNQIRSLESLQTALQTIGGSHEPQIRHGVVLFASPPPYDAEAIHPCIYSSCQRRLDAIAVPMAGDVSQVHYLFADHTEEKCHETLQQIKEVLRAKSSTISALPSWVAMPHRLLLECSGLNDSFTRWMQLLYSLASRTDQNVVKAEIEFGLTTKDLTTSKSWGPSIAQQPGMRPWQDFATIPGFDVIELLTSRTKKDQGVDHWRQKHSDAGTSLPEVMSASLTKPIIYASINAIDFFLHRCASPRKAVTKASSIKAGGVTSYSDLETLLLARLIAQHGDLNDKKSVETELRAAEKLNSASRIEAAQKAIARRCTPLSQKIIIDDINRPRDESKQYNQSEVSKAFKRLLGRLGGNERRAMTTYKVLCKADRIAEALHALQRDPQEPARTWKSLSGIAQDGLTYSGIVRRHTRRGEHEYSSEAAEVNLSDAAGDGQSAGESSAGRVDVNKNATGDSIRHH